MRKGTNVTIKHRHTLSALLLMIIAISLLFIPYQTIHGMNDEFIVVAQNGGSKITSPYDTIIVANSGNRTMDSVKIQLSPGLENSFLLSTYAIKSIKPGSGVVVDLVFNGKIDPKNKQFMQDYVGYVMILSEHHNPKTLPIEIRWKNILLDIEEYTVSSLYGKDAVTSAVDKIVISNIGDRKMDSVRLIPSAGFRGNFLLSEYSIRSIAPGTNATIELKLNIGKEYGKSFFEEHVGYLTIVSEHHTHKFMPIKVLWNKFELGTFSIYSRINDEDIDKAKQVAEFLDENHGLLGLDSTQKTRMYLASNPDEYKLVTSANIKCDYSVEGDVALLSSYASDVEGQAMHELTAKSLADYAPHWIRSKWNYEGGNWLVGGLSDYGAYLAGGESGIVKMHLDAYVNNPTELEWYGKGGDAQFGAAYTFFRYIENRYGSDMVKNIMDSAVHMPNLYGCENTEECVITDSINRNVDTNEKNGMVDFSIIKKGWREYIKNVYDVDISKIKIPKVDGDQY